MSWLLVIFWSLLSHGDKPIKIDWVSDLDFGTAIQGDPAKTIPPGSSENNENASFDITGKQGVTYNIVLPTSITMTTPGGGVNSISVSQFVSNPAQGANGFLGPKGKQTLYVGATRGPIASNQKRGSYVGTFTVTVVY